MRRCRGERGVTSHRIAVPVSCRYRVMGVKALNKRSAVGWGVAGSRQVAPGHKLGQRQHAQGNAQEHEQAANAVASRKKSGVMARRPPCKRCKPCAGCHCCREQLTAPATLRREAGVLVSLSTGTSFTPASFVINEFGYNQGWRLTQHPRFLADVNGDGKQDVVGFGDAGVWLALSAGTSFGPANFVVANYGYNQAWRVPLHPRFLADVNGDGRQDVVGIGDAGVYASPSIGASFAAPGLWINQYGYSDGWR
jgi:hypothetical protein